MKTIFKHNETNKEVKILAEFEGILPVCKDWNYSNHDYSYRVYKVELNAEGNLICLCSNEVKA
jgi:hypothetical protein